MLFLSLGLLFAFWLLGRVAGRALSGVKDVPILSREDSPAYFRASPRQRRIFHLAGPVVAYLLTTLLGFGALRMNGVPAPGLVVEVTAGGPAAAAGMLSGDHVVEVDGVDLEGAPDIWESFVGAVKKVAPGGTLAVRVRRDDGLHLLSVRADGEGKIRVLRRHDRVATPAAEAFREALIMPVSALARFARSVKGAWFDEGRATLAGSVGVMRDTVELAVGPGKVALYLALLVFPMAAAWPLVVALELLVRPRRASSQASPSRL